MIFVVFLFKTAIVEIDITEKSNQGLLESNDCGVFLIAFGITQVRFCGNTG